MASPTDRTHTIAVFCDFENLAIGVKDAQYDKFDMNKVLDRLLLKRGDHLSLFTAPAALERDYDAVPESYEAVIDAVVPPATVGGVRFRRSTVEDSSDSSDRADTETIFRTRLDVLVWHSAA